VGENGDFQLKSRKRPRLYC